jgi:hypothetical protein
LVRVGRACVAGARRGCAISRHCLSSLACWLSVARCVSVCRGWLIRVRRTRRAGALGGFAIGRDALPLLTSILSRTAYCIGGGRIRVGSAWCARPLLCLPRRVLLILAGAARIAPAILPALRSFCSNAIRPDFPLLPLASIAVPVRLAAICVVECGATEGIGIWLALPAGSTVGGCLVPNLIARAICS